MLTHKLASTSRAVPSDMPWDSPIGSTLFSIFIDSMLTESVGRPKFQGTANMKGDIKQLILANLEGWVCTEKN